LRTETFELFGVEYTIRQATKGELEQALRFDIEEDAEDFLIKSCLVSPKIDLNEVYAGIPGQLAVRILELSDATQEANERLQKEADERVLTPLGKIEALMMGILHLRPVDISNMTSEDWHKAASAAQLLAIALHPEFDMAKYMALGTQEEKKKNPVRDLLSKLPPVANR